MISNAINHPSADSSANRVVWIGTHSNRAVEFRNKADTAIVEIANAYQEKNSAAFWEATVVFNHFRVLRTLHEAASIQQYGHKSPEQTTEQADI